MEQAILSLHSHRPEIVSRLVHVPNALPTVLDGFSNLTAEGVRVSVHHVFYAENYRNFEDFVRFYAERLWQPGLTELSVSNIILLHPELRRRPECVPRLSDVAPYLETGVRLARRYGFEIGRGASEDAFPECVFGVGDHVQDKPPQERWIVSPVSGELGLIFAGTRKDVPDRFASGARDYNRVFTHVRACESCARKPVCLGVQSDYVALYGDGEIKGVS